MNSYSNLIQEKREIDLVNYFNTYPYSNQLVFTHTISKTVKEGSKPYNVNIINSNLEINADVRDQDYTLEITATDPYYYNSNQDMNINIHEKPPLDILSSYNNIYPNFTQYSHIIDLSSDLITYLPSININYCNVTFSEIFNKGKYNGELDQASTILSNLIIYPEYRGTTYIASNIIYVEGYKEQSILLTYLITECNLPIIEFNGGIDMNDYSNLIQEKREIDLVNYFNTYPYSNQLVFTYSILETLKIGSKDYNVNIINSNLEINADVRDQDYTINIIATDLHYDNSNEDIIININEKPPLEILSSYNNIYNNFTQYSQTIDLSYDLITYLPSLNLNYCNVTFSEIFNNGKYNGGLHQASNILNNLVIYPEYRGTTYIASNIIYVEGYEEQTILLTYFITECNLPEIIFNGGIIQDDYSNLMKEKREIDLVNYFNTYPYSNQLVFTCNIVEPLKIGSKPYNVTIINSGPGATNLEINLDVRDQNYSIKIIATDLYYDNSNIEMIFNINEKPPLEILNRYFEIKDLTQYSQTIDLYSEINTYNLSQYIITSTTQTIIPIIHYKFTEDIGIESNLIDYGSLYSFHLKMKMDFVSPSCPGLDPILISGTTFYYLQFLNGTCNITFTENTICDILIVGGGGGGGSNIGLGGGSSGGLIYATNISISPNIYSISVGSGGLAGKSGENTTAFQAIATGGVSSLTGDGAGPGTTNTVGSVINNPNINLFALKGGISYNNSFYYDTTDLPFWYRFNYNNFLVNSGSEGNNYDLINNNTKPFSPNIENYIYIGINKSARIPNYTFSTDNNNYVISFKINSSEDSFLTDVSRSIIIKNNILQLSQVFGNIYCYHKGKSFRTDVNDSEGRKYKIITDFTNFPDKWLNLVFVFKENVESKIVFYLYIDGINVYGPALDFSSSSSATQPEYMTLADFSDLSPSYIGITQANNANILLNFTDFRIYTRELTNDEILELYNGPGPPKIGGGGGGIKSVGISGISTLGGTGGIGSNISIINTNFQVGEGGKGATEGVEDIETVIGIGYGGDGSINSTGKTGGPGIVIIKWNISQESVSQIPITLSKTINNTLPSYNSILQNAYYFSSISNYVSYEGNSLNINNLLTSFHNNNGFSIHFVLSNVL
jgi:hypothetical protein